MIRMTFTGVQWGLDMLGDDADPESKGVQINLLDPQANIVAHVPFTGDALPALVAQITQGLTDDQKKELAPLFDTTGLALPGRDFKPEDIIQGNGPRPEQGPQG